jgi:hypothetical protein
MLQGCKEVHMTLASRTNQRQALDGHFSVEVVRYSRDCKGTHISTICHTLICAILLIAQTALMLDGHCRASAAL